MQLDPKIPDKHPEIGRFLKEHEDNIVSVWKDLMVRAKGVNTTGTASFSIGIEDPDDLLCCLFESLLTGSASEVSLSRIVNRLRLPESSIADFILEKSCLLMAINSAARDYPAGGAKGQVELHSWLHLQQIADHIMKETGIAFERVVKHGGRAFCQVDASITLELF